MAGHSLDATHRVAFCLPPRISWHECECLFSGVAKKTLGMPFTTPWPSPDQLPKQGGRNAQDTLGKDNRVPCVAEPACIPRAPHLRARV